MQRQTRLAKLVKAGEEAKQKLGIKEQPTKEDVNRHKWKGSM
jgi:hypothetical protein